MNDQTASDVKKEAADLAAKLQPRSGKFRKISPEMDPLRLGSGWTVPDLDKPQVIIESTFGDSHPGSAGLFELVEEVRKGVAEAGGHGARYFCTDMCDGEAQGHDGINYSLPSRDMIACTAAPTTCSMPVLRASGRRSSSTMPAACRASWRRSSRCSTSTS